MRHVKIPDPDGNAIAFAVPPERQESVEERSTSWSSWSSCHGTISQKRFAGPPRRCEDPAHGRVSLSGYGY